MSVMAWFTHVAFSPCVQGLEDGFHLNRLVAGIFGNTCTLAVYRYFAEARTHLADKVLSSLVPQLILNDRRPVQLPTVSYGRGTQKQEEPCALLWQNENRDGSLRP